MAQVKKWQEKEMELFGNKQTNTKKNNKKQASYNLIYDLNCHSLTWCHSCWCHLQWSNAHAKKKKNIIFTKKKSC